MKTLIVDDEKHVRDAIKLLVDWKSLGIETVLEAEDGRSAVAILESERPQIVFTDVMMPAMSGIELLRWIRTNAPEVKTIVISGHDDFEFVRGTMQYGGMDYLLKPIDAGQLQEVTEKAVRSWTEEERERCESRQKSMRIHRLVPVYCDKIFSNLIAKPASFFAEKESFLLEFPGLADADRCRASILSLDPMQAELRDKFASHTDLLLFTLTNVCNEFLGEARTGFAFRYWNSAHQIVLVHWSGLERTPELLARINDGFHRTLKARFDFGVGGVKPFPLGLNDSYAEAEAALRQRNLLRRKTWVHEFEPKEAVRPTEMLHLSDFEEKIRLALISGSKDTIGEAIRAWIDRVKKLDAVSMEHLELWRHEFSVLKARWLKEFFPGDAPEMRLPLETAAFAVPFDERGELSLERWREELTDGLVRLSEHVQKVLQQENNLIYDIAKYIRNHLDEDLSVQDIAAHFYLSREYVSRRFKQEFGETISDYILRNRMERAKTLLVNPHLKIVQVAHMVGYDDEKYFGKVFKKTFGLSPGEYRKRQLD